MTRGQRLRTQRTHYCGKPPKDATRCRGLNRLSALTFPRPSAISPRDFFTRPQPGGATAKKGGPKPLGAAFRCPKRQRPDRRHARETDLSTLEARAQAPPWFPRPYGHQRRPQGHRGPPFARPQAPFCLIAHSSRGGDRHDRESISAFRTRRTGPCGSTRHPQGARVFV